MKARLLKKGLWHVVNTGPTGEEKREKCDAFDFLVSTISESILSRVLDATTASDMWQKLRKLYASTDASIVIAIEGQIHRFKNSSGSMENHFNEFRLLIARLKSAGGDMSHVLHLLHCALSHARAQLTCKTIRLTSDLAKLTLESFSLKMLKHKCIIDAKQGPVKMIPKSGSFYVTECLIDVTDSPARETVTMIDKKVTFAVATDPTKVWHQKCGHLGTQAIVATSKKEIFLGIPKL
jgi:hypothetical protein